MKRAHVVSMGPRGVILAAAGSVNCQGTDRGEVDSDASETDEGWWAEYLVWTIQEDGRRCGQTEAKTDDG